MKKDRYASLSEINVTNLVDVTLVLLIVFMISAPFLRKGIEIRLPKAEAENVHADDPLIVTLTRDSLLYLNKEPLAVEEIGTRLAELYRQKGQAPVLLQADRQIPYGRVIFVMDRMRKSGISNLALVVEPGEEP